MTNDNNKEVLNMYSIELQMEELVEIIEKTIEVRINIEKDKKDLKMKLLT